MSVEPRTSPASPRLGATTEAAELELADDPAVAMDPADLGLDGVRADMFREGREAGGRPRDTTGTFRIMSLTRLLRS